MRVALVGELVAQRQDQIYCDRRVASGVRGADPVAIETPRGLGAAGVHRDPSRELAQLRDRGQQTAAEPFVVDGFAEHRRGGGELAFDQFVKIVAADEVI
ncbi:MULTISPECIES: hypothetical protein [unclassified Frankia]|uniref:hypothetical protein n=1 Tax=unclassified Frankia TaxID=2632575 RepID=UPI002AD5A18F|nr:MULTISPECIES: hypothetical protein [unclassified Frankia]